MYKNNCYWGPQGWILHPLFYLLFIKDLPPNSNLMKTVLFADDTV